MQVEKERIRKNVPVAKNTQVEAGQINIITISTYLYNIQKIVTSSKKLKSKIENFPNTQLSIIIVK